MIALHIFYFQPRHVKQNPIWNYVAFHLYTLLKAGYQIITVLVQ